MLTKEQERIFQGFKEIGPSIANFYVDAVRLTDTSCTLASKANLIAHLAREIDGGLLSVFAPKKIKEEKLLISGEDRGHFASILAAVGKDDVEDLLAKEWFSVAKKFHKVAHRQEVHKPSKDIAEILSLWARYEKILETFIGSFYAILARLDSFLSMKEPPQESISALKNILAKEKHAAYFFGKVHEPKWLPLLSQAGFFELSAAPRKEETMSYPEEWIATRCLVNMAKIENNGFESQIKSISDNIIGGFVRKEIELHPYTIANITQLIALLPNYSFSEAELTFFEKVSSAYSEPMLFFNTYLSDEFPDRLLKNDDKDSLKNLLSYFFGFSIYEEPEVDFGDFKISAGKKRKNNIEDFRISEFLHKYGERVLESLGIDGMRIVIEKIRTLDKIESYELSQFSVSSIEPSDQYQLNDAWEASLINFIRDFGNKLPSDDLLNLTDELLYSKVSILQRLAFHLIRTNYSTLKNKWWEYVKNNDEDVYIHEPYLLIKETSQDYDKRQFENIIKWIENISTLATELDPDMPEDKRTSYNNYRVRRWLTALSTKTPDNNKLLEATIEHYNALNDWEIKHPEFDSYTTSFAGPDMPIEIDTFLPLPLSEQITFIKSFSPKNEFYSSLDGLTVVLKSCVVRDPDKYVFGLDQFLIIKTQYLTGLMEGITDALRDDNISDFTPIINFLDKKLQTEEFQLTQEEKIDNRKEFIFRLIDFIRTLSTKDSKFIFTRENFKQINDIIIGLLNNTGFMDDSEEINRNYIHHALNSIQGRLHLALIDLSLLFARLNLKEEGAVKWAAEVKEYFASRLDKTSNVDKDFRITIGSRLPLFLYFDKSWVNENINSIFPNYSQQHLEYAIGGALSGMYKPSKDFYNLFKAHKLFEKALKIYDYECGYLDNIIVYAILEWQFWDLPPTDTNSILYKILKKEKPGQFKRLIDIAWKIKTLSYDKIKILWSNILEIADGKEEFNLLYFQMLWFAELAPTLDDGTILCLNKTFAGIKREGKDANSFMRHIFKIADSNLKAAAEMILTLYESKIASPYFEKELNEFVNKLYQNNMKQSANEICIGVSETGSLALKDIFTKNNS